MMPIRAAVATVLLCAFTPLPALALGKEKAKYVGGTLATIPEGTEGTLATSDPAKMIFIAEKGRGVLEVPWKDVTELEYGQKVGRRWKSAILLSPVAIFMKGRKHYLTVSYKDAQGADQAAVLELGKELVRTTLTVVETRTGRKITYQDEEAAKARAQ